MSCPENFTAIITGASSGIGECFARELAKNNYNLLLIARREEKLEQLAIELEDLYDISTEVFPADLGKMEEITRVVDKIKNTGSIFFLINNAGFATRGSFVDVDSDKHKKMISVHITASTLITQAVLPSMLERKEGAIINVASISGLLKSRGSPNYASTKAYLIKFSEMLDLEVRGTNIKVQALCPGYTHTEFHSVRDFEGFNKKTIPNFLWMKSEDVVIKSIQSLRKNKVIVVPGRKNRLIVRLVNSKILGRLIIRIMFGKR